MRGYYSLPLLAKGKLRGVLGVFQRTPQPVEAEWREFLESLASQAALAIGNAEMVTSIKRTNTELLLTYDDTLSGWARAMELRGEEAPEHTLAHHTPTSGVCWCILKKC